MVLNPSNSSNSEQLALKGLARCDTCNSTAGWTDSRTALDRTVQLSNANPPDASAQSSGYDTMEENASFLSQKIDCTDPSALAQSFEDVDC